MYAVLREEFDRRWSDELLKGPSAGKPSAVSKSQLPTGVVGSAEGGRRDICEINVAFRRITVPAKHGIDSFLELRVVRLVDAACVYPKELQTVTPCLISTKSDLVIADFVFAYTIHQILKTDLLLLRTPGMRKYRISGNVAGKKLGQADLAGGIAFEKTHRSGRPGFGLSP
jgi:hypothetical protein